ncbi:PREDICTED: L10-interacting MYB domain-containing protein-like [Camelina sativa]|uniref:L10-interacting MYB domain-containing protein-like n=1 Tax=Camelina sativa TaxID=90675 RepID=A0ABM0XU97_CAMSA|nr:PREDICTED: L10-interacting MYB domain-containing protein-like [Camelina sativa]XP_010491119.1 PREDICTED: L10-interacting MYB domain-containing protein-like [Camelina sativa]XP_010491120.1 PREDICTED: L10-interacting MYB domain-containing protein-like [Camelina sativa]XP_010491121.1 PREDICTED: L10-interacting MYB domain-containing protein-like [Camelina sativa]XP_010491122.1 PREDICTED: L10-interacting MYB domain-containing protein-like [Camelina sativa]XP_010491123.1 PREDICTED: L10-interactin
MRPKAVWEPEYHRVFVELCVEQTLLGNKPGTHFTKEGWRNILSSFQEKTGAMYDRMQLKNHWDTMGRQWKIWRRLVECSYMSWDPETNTFGASDDDWAIYLQENPDAGQYRLSVPQDLKKLEIIFAGRNVEVKDEVVLLSSVVKKRRRSCYEEEDEDNQSMCSSSNPQTKGYWSPSTHELFLNLLVQETLKGNRPEAHFNKEGWKTILETINDNTGLSYTRAQLKNHWDCTRKAWKVWCQLVGASSMKWDPETRSFGATEEDWRIYIRENPKAGLFRHKEVPHADQLAIIFNGVIEPGETYTPPSRLRKKLLYNRSESPQWNDPTPLSKHHRDEAETSRLNGGYAESRLQEDRIESETAQRLDAMKSMSEGMLQESPVCVEIESAKLMYSIGECIQSLDAMNEVEEGSELYLFALDLFLKREYREIFLELKKPSLRIAWLQRLHSASLAVTTT